VADTQPAADQESAEAAKERRPSYGRAVDPETRRVRFLSVSAIDRANEAIGSGCLRRWFYHYILKIKEGETKSTARGNERHLQMANYYRTGEKALPKQILANAHMMPARGPGLHVELSIVPTTEPVILPDGTEQPRDIEAELAAAPLRVAGIPMTGAIDLINDRCLNVGGSDVEDTRDPPGTIELLDWKFPGDLKNAKTGLQLLGTTQMAGYAEWLQRVSPETPYIRLSHVYMPVRGSGTKATIRIEPGATAKTWEHAESVARSIAHAAQEQDVHKIPANTRACDSFGRECPALDRSLPEHLRCQAGRHNSLQNMFGVTGSAALIPPTDLVRPRETTQPMSNLQLPPINAGQSVIAMIKQRQQAQLQQPTAQPPVIQPGVTTAAPTPAASIDVAEIARLQAEEAAAKARAAVPPGFQEAWATILRVTSKMTASDGTLGVGFPALGGDAARHFAAMTNTALNGAGFAGTGEFGGTMYSTADQVIQAAAELAGIEAQMSAAPAAQSQPALAPLQAPETPASNPAPVVAQTVTQPSTAGPGSTATAGDPLAAIVAQANKKAGGKGKKKDQAGEAANAAAKQTAPDTTAPAPGEAREAAAEGAFYVYVNCTPSMPYQRLEPVVWELLARLSAEAGGDDVRTTNPDGPLGFGRWKGALRSFINVTPIPAGHYVIDATSEAMAEAAGAFCELAHKSGGGFIKGPR
jgi:hypothetical protein